jgi:hypothetical protein
MPARNREGEKSPLGKPMIPREVANKRNPAAENSHKQPPRCNEYDCAEREDPDGKHDDSKDSVRGRGILSPHSLFNGEQFVRPSLQNKPGNNTHEQYGPGNTSEQIPIDTPLPSVEVRLTPQVQLRALRTHTIRRRDSFSRSCTSDRTARQLQRVR